MSSGAREFYVNVEVYGSTGSDNTQAAVARVNVVMPHAMGETDLENLHGECAEVVARFLRGKCPDAKPAPLGPTRATVRVCAIPADEPGGYRKSERMFLRARTVSWPTRPLTISVEYCVSIRPRTY